MLFLIAVLLALESETVSINSLIFFGAARQATAKWGSTSASVPWDIDYVAVYTKVSNNKEYMLFDCLAFYFGTMIV